MHTCCGVEMHLSTYLLHINSAHGVQVDEVIGALTKLENERFKSDWRTVIKASG